MVAVGHMDPLQKECIDTYFLLSDENYKRPLQNQSRKITWKYKRLIDDPKNEARK
jgi:hypothetical protein